MKIQTLAMSVLFTAAFVGGAYAARAFSDSTNVIVVAEALKPTTWDKIEGNWKENKGKLRQQWGKLTDNDVEVMKGKREELRGLIQQRYGITVEQADKEIDLWLKSLAN